MNEVRREELNEIELKDCMRIISDPTQRFTHDQKGIVWDHIIASYHALADRLAAAEELNRVAALGMSALEQQLAEAQGTIIRKDEALGINRQAHGIVRDQLTQAEQQMARLEQLPKAVEKFLNDISAVPPWESAGEIWAQRIMELHASYLATKEPATILRETGAGE